LAKRREVGEQGWMHGRYVPCILHNNMLRPLNPLYYALQYLWSSHCFIILSNKYHYLLNPSPILLSSLS